MENTKTQDREYWVVKVNNQGVAIEDIKGPFSDYKSAWDWASDNVNHDKWTIVRRK